MNAPAITGAAITGTDATARLAALGRRLLAREQRLRRPAAPLQRPLLWVQLFVDPLAVLEARLAAPGAPAAAAGQGAEADRAAPGFAWPAAPPPVPAAPPPRTADAGPNAEAGPPVSPPAPAQSSALPPAGLRLTRDQTALQAILHANLGPEPPADGRRETGPETTAAPALPAFPFVADTPAAVSQTGWLAQSAQTGAARRSDTAVQPASVGEEGQTAAGAASPAAQTQVGAAAPPANGQAHPGGGHMSAWPRQEQTLAQAVHAAALPGEPLHGTPFSRPGAAARRLEDQGAGASTAVGPALAPPAAPVNWGTATAPPPDVGLVWAEDEPAASPLSSAQINQVLTALDERLELLLLRMYGTAGG